MWRAKFYKSNFDNILGYVNVDIDGITVKGFKVMKGKEGKGSWLAMPSQKIKDKKTGGEVWIETVEISDKKIKDDFSAEILKQYHTMLAKVESKASDVDKPQEPK